MDLSMIMSSQENIKQALEDSLKPSLSTALKRPTSTTNVMLTIEEMAARNDNEPEAKRQKLSEQGDAPIVPSSELSPDPGPHLPPNSKLMADDIFAEIKDESTEMTGVVAEVKDEAAPQTKDDDDQMKDVAPEAKTTLFAPDSTTVQPNGSATTQIQDAAPEIKPAVSAPPPMTTSPIVGTTPSVLGKRTREDSVQPPTPTVNKWLAFQKKMWEEKLAKDAKFNYAEAKEKERKDREKAAEKQRLEREFNEKQALVEKKSLLEMKEKEKAKGKGKKAEEDE